MLNAMPTGPYPRRSLQYTTIEPVKLYPRLSCAGIPPVQEPLDPADIYDHDKERGKWSHDMEYYFAIIGHGVGIRSIALFSFALGTYYVLWPVFSLTISIFIFSAYLYLEGCVGQFGGTGFLSAFRASPPMKGFGYAMLGLNLVTVIYYSVIGAYPLALLYKLCTYEVPWTDEPYIPQLDNLTLQEELLIQNRKFDGTSHMSVYFLKQISRYMNGWQDKSLAPAVMIGVTIIWVLVTVCLIKGIKSVGKAVYITAGISFLLNFLIFVQGNIQRELPFEGTDSRNFLLTGQFWLQTFVAPMFVLSQGNGVLLTMSSYNRFRSPLHRSPIWIYFFIYWGNKLPIVFGAQFSVLMQSLGFDSGYIGNNVNTFNLAFLLYPEFTSALNRSQLWTVILYVSLFFSELHSVVIQTFAILTSIFDEFPVTRRQKIPITIAACLIFCGLAISLASEGVLPPVDKMIYIFAVIQVIFIVGEGVAFIWCYGYVKFKNYCKFMLPSATYFLNAHVITIILPLLTILTLVLMFFLSYEGLPDSYSIFTLPAVSAVAAACLSVIIIYFIYDTTTKRCKDVFKSEKWFPSDEKDHMDYVHPISLGYRFSQPMIWPINPQPTTQPQPQPQPHA